MGGDPLPRRIAIAFAFVASLALAPAATAQSRLQNPRIEESSHPRVVVGVLNVQACGRYAAAGDGSDIALNACDHALNEPLNRAGVMATRINRGVIYLRRRQPDLALTDFDYVIAMAPENAEAHVNRGSALMMLEEPGLAVAAFTDALSRGVAAPEQAYFNRGAAREALGDIRGAFEDYSTALEIQPDWGPANQELARFVRTRRERLAEYLGQTDREPQ